MATTFELKFKKVIRGRVFTQNIATSDEKEMSQCADAFVRMGWRGQSIERKDSIITVYSW